MRLPFSFSSTNRFRKEKNFHFWVFMAQLSTSLLWASPACCLMSPENLKIPAQSHRFPKEAWPCMSSFKADVALSTLSFARPIFCTTTHVCNMLNKKWCWNRLSKSTYSIVWIYFLWSSLRSKLGRCLLLLQFTTASFYWAVKNNTITSNHINLTWTTLPFCG